MSHEWVRLRAARTAIIGLGLALLMGCGSGSGDAGDASSDADATTCDCDDGIACTRDLCDMASGACSHVPNHSACSGDWQCNPSSGCEPRSRRMDPCEDCGLWAPRGSLVTCDPPDFVCRVECPDGEVDIEGECRPMSCATTGTSCGADAGCSAGGCLGEASEPIGGDADPIGGLPDGGVALSRTLWPGGYCSPNVGDAGSVTTACDPADATDAVCGACGRCVARDGVNRCLRACTPTLSDNDICREGYECKPSSAACEPGCASDDECRVYRADSNGVAGLQTPEDCRGDSTRPVAEQRCGGRDDGFDPLVYDTASTAVCDPATFRCTNPGTASASAGTPCTRDAQCEEGGECLPAEAGWPGGYCSKSLCDPSANACAGEGRCLDGPLGRAVCLAGCEVAQGADPADATTWTNNRGGCREGYACAWDGLHREGTTNGGCVPGNFSAVTTGNVGAPCAADADCYSPFGRGVCLTPSADGSGFVDGYCALLDCAAPGVPAGVCGDGAQCVPLGPDSTASSMCFASCGSASDCRPGYACADLDGDPTTGGVCIAVCSSDAQCRATERCELRPDGSSGRCVAR